MNYLKRMEGFRNDLEFLFSLFIGINLGFRLEENGGNFLLIFNDLSVLFPIFPWGYVRNLGR